MTLYQKARVRWDETDRIPEEAQGKFCWVVAEPPKQNLIVLNREGNIRIDAEANYTASFCTLENLPFAIPKDDLELLGNEEAFCSEPPPEIYEEWLARPRTAEEEAK